MEENIDLEHIITIATQIGTRVAVETMRDIEKEKRANQYDRRLRNTKLLLRNYRNLIEHCGEATFDKRYSNIYEELEELNSSNDNNLYIESIKRSKERTLIIIDHINKMLDVYRILSEQSTKPENIRKYKVIKAMYIDKTEKIVEQIAEELYCNERTVYRDRDYAVRELSTLLFGIDGLKTVD